MNSPSVHWLNNPFDFSDVTSYPVESKTTISEWLTNHGGLNRLNRLPTVCVYQGKELCRSEYDQVIEDAVCFVTLPTGGDSGSNPLQVVAMLAMAVYAPALAGGLLKGTALAGSTLATSMLSSGIMMGGAMLISAVFPPPGLPNSATPSTGSPTYSLGAQGNAARLGSPIPVNYGRMRIYPDFAAAA